MQIKCIPAARGEVSGKITAACVIKFSSATLITDLITDTITFDCDPVAIVYTTVQKYRRLTFDKVYFNYCDLILNLILNLIFNLLSDISRMKMTLSLWLE